MQFIWAIFGFACLAFAILGIVLPLVPTVPFLLLAAFSFARSSNKLHVWLVSHPIFGPPIEDWRLRGAVRTNAKRLVTLSIGIVFLFSLVVGLKTLVLVIQALILICVLIFIWTRPSL